MPCRPSGKSKKNHKKALWKKQNGLCAYCNKEMNNRGQYRNSATLDHIIPRSKGGVNARHNLVLCCKECNELKGDTIKLTQNGNIVDSFLISQQSAN